MNTAEIAASIAALALVINVFRDMLNGGWSMSSRLTKIEATMTALQQSQDQLAKAQERQASLLERLADMKTEQKLMDQRMLFLEEDIRLLRVGAGYIKDKNARSIDREYGG